MVVPGATSGLGCASGLGWAKADAENAAPARAQSVAGCRSELLCMRGRAKKKAGVGQTAAVARSSVRRYSREFINGFRRNTPAGEEWARELDHEAHDGPLVAAWLGHATVLVRLGDKWILTDPVFSQRVGIRLGPLTFGVGRLLPAIDPALLPPLDLILVSHAHFDHLDRP